MGRALFDQILDLGESRMIDVVVADLDRRRGMARTDAGRTHDPDVGHALGLHSAMQRSAPANMHDRLSQTRIGHRRVLRFAVGDDIEVGIECRHLVDLGHGDAHQFRKAMQMARRQAGLGILDLVQIFDQQRPLVRSVPMSALHAVDFGRFEHTPFRIRAAHCGVRHRDGSARLALPEPMSLGRIVHAFRSVRSPGR